MKRLSIYKTVVSGLGLLLASTVVAGETFDLVVTGETRHWSDGSAAPSCFVYRHPPDGYFYEGATGSGAYRIDPDGDGQDLYDVYCDMDTDGGGWTLVANQVNNGNWIDLDSNLSPDANYGTYSPVWDHATFYYTSFAALPHAEVLFKSGNGQVWCTTYHDALTGLQTSLTAETVPVLASANTARQAGQKTNVLQRDPEYPPVNPRSPEDPWFGCEGGHWANTKRMLWGESNYPLYTDFKNQNQGIGLFVR